METLKQKFPFVEEEILKHYNEKEIKMMKELKIINKERELRIKAEEYKANMTLKCLNLQSKLEAALKELEKLKVIKNVRDIDIDNESKYKD